MVRVCYVISFVNKALAFELIAETIRKDQIELSFVLLNDEETDFEKFLKEGGFKVIRINYRNKLQLVPAILKTAFYLIRNKIDVVHAHLYDGSLVGLCAATLARTKKRIHTRHHSSYHHDYFPKAVKVDKFHNMLSTHIVAISNNVKNVLVEMDKADASKITVIYHGFKLDEFKSVPQHRIDKLRSTYNPGNDGPVIGVISRYLKLKGIEYTIEAFSQLLMEFPNARLILANASGADQDTIRKRLGLVPKKNYVEIEFENDLYALYKLFDIFVHVPIDEKCEAFGQIYVESLASGIPSIFTLSGIAPEFVVDEKNAMVAGYKSAASILENMRKLLTDEPLRKRLILNGYADVKEKFDHRKTTLLLEELYLN
jgi:glycosyltransferase involved in cell wall biosynthesis